MAHEITIRADGYAEMAFVGDTPWHGLGQELPAEADMATWRQAAGMDWTIEKSPVEYRITDAVGHQTVPQRFVQYRSDTGMPLSVVSERYKPVQPHEVLSFFDDLVKESGFRLHTAGTLFGGKRMWALAETGRYGEVSKDDGVGGFLLLSTSADKSLATTARFTTVRVVCNNTLSLAHKRDAYVSFTHSRAFDHELMKAKLGRAVESFGAFMEMAQHLRKQRVTAEAASAFVRRLVLTNEQLVDPDYNYGKNRAYAKIINLFNGEAKGAELVGDSKWGLLNAVTEYYDHHMPARTADARLNNTWFGKGDEAKSIMTDMLLAA